ncbi:uncharacterized protein LOC142229677 isoform X2 [Haematobia irritans]|uniref:uncharacterized protein LOC142229677 isoform X2 n=1 Tax=Haematobia irritans TaxID=7368 RepID=UPI003F5089A0
MPIILFKNCAKKGRYRRLPNDGRKNYNKKNVRISCNCGQYISSYVAIASLEAWRVQVCLEYAENPAQKTRVRFGCHTIVNSFGSGDWAIYSNRYLKLMGRTTSQLQF